MSEKPKEEFTFWKRPWAKWIVFVAAFFQFSNLFFTIKDYKKIAAANILSPSEWENYAFRERFSITLMAFTGAVFLIIFLTGFFVKSKSEMQQAEKMTLITLTLAWAIAGLLLRFPSQQSTGIIWFVSLILLISLSIYTFFRKQKV